LAGPVRAPLAAALLDVGLDDELDAGVLLDEELLGGLLLEVDDGVLLDEELLDGVLLDGVLLDGVLLDGVLVDGVLLDEDVGAVVGVVVELEDDVVELEVDVVGGVSQPVTQKTLCLTSAPRAPSALMVSLTWNPCCGCGAMPVKSSV